MPHHARFLTLGAVSAVLAACGELDRSAAASADPTAPAEARATAQCKPAPPDHTIPLPLAPSSQRVDLITPRFSHPTRVTHPLFPIARLHQVILVGQADGAPMRTETTLLPGTNPIEFGTGRVSALTSQYIAYVDRRIDEVALDWYAQDDAGNVWYLGEDVFNYEGGEVADRSGTWLACRDGPAAMIMPAHPAVGDAFRPENAWPIVFEEVQVTATGQTVLGPHGPVTGAITTRELHMDGSYSDKIFAPGYGEFHTGLGANFESLALAVPTDALPGREPAQLELLLTNANLVFRAAKSGNWSAASRLVKAMSEGWERYPENAVPHLLGPIFEQSLGDLTEAVKRRSVAESRQAAVDAERIGLDLSLQHEARVDVDFDRLAMWARQTEIDADARDTEGLRSDVSIMEWIIARLVNVDDDDDRRVVRLARRNVDALRGAVDGEDFSAVLAAATRLQRLLRD